MDLALYTSTAGRCVLMPECFLPSTESERRYGPLRRCGSVATSSLQVPLVAWYLGVPMRAVERGFTASHLDFQLRPRASSPWPSVDGHRVVASEGRWRVLRSSCAPRVETQAPRAARADSD